jgi:hypothetical protein
VGLIHGDIMPSNIFAARRGGMLVARPRSGGFPSLILTGIP